MLEVGMTVVFLFGLIFLVMDLSMLLFIRSTLQQAVRDGVREGVTWQHPSGSYVNDNIKQAVQDASLGFLNGPAGACRIQVNYFDPNTGTASTGGQGDVLVVSVNNFGYTPLGAVLKSANPLSFSVSSSDIVERCPLEGCISVANPKPPTCP